MKRETITISDNGAVTIPSKTRMNISEIANLLGIYYQTAKRHVRAIEKSGVASGDYSMSCTAERQKIYPDYYGLDMIIAVAFRVQSAQVEIFQRWIMKQIIKRNSTTTIVLTTKNFNIFN